MRQTWLGNGHKSYPWDKSLAFKDPSSDYKPIKRSITPTNTNSWKGISLITSEESQITRNFSPSPRRYQESNQS